MQVTSTLVVWLFIGSSAAYSCTNDGSNSRLKSYCFTNEVAAKSNNFHQIQILDYLYKLEGYSTGLGLPSRVDAFTSNYFVLPVVDYSTNINGGNPDRPLELGSLTFAGNPMLIKKAGGIAGARLGGNGRHIYGQGRYVDFYAAGSLLRSIDYRLQIVQNSLSLCSKNYIEKNWYLDLCATSARTKKDLTDSIVQTTSFSFARLFTSNGNNYHQANAGLIRLFESNYTQNQLMVKLDTIHSNGFFSSISLTAGETMVDTLTTKFRLGATIGTVLFERDMSLVLSYSKAGNGKILDFDQEEVARSVSIQYSVTPFVNVSFGYSDTNSNIDYFDQREPSFGVSFSPLEF